MTDTLRGPVACGAVRCARTALVFGLLAGSSCSEDPFDVDVAPDERYGGIRVAVMTGGVDIDSSFSLRIVRANGTSHPITDGDTLLLPGLVPGDYTLLLEDILPNCTVDGPNPITVTVEAGYGTIVTFRVVCILSTGAAEVTIATTGVDLDPDGYVIIVNDARRFQHALESPVNGTTFFPHVSLGPAALHLEGATPNCDPAEPYPVAITVPSGDTVSVEMEVVCLPVQQLAYSGSSDGTTDIFVIDSNGTGATRITAHPARDDEPAWSPDGTRIAFTTDRDGNREIYVTNADGSNPVRLTSEPLADYAPAWSPDGTRIVFVSERSGAADLYVMNADGTNPTPITSDADRDSDPAWSPDGRTIAFTKHLSGANSGVYRIDVDGSGPVRRVSPLGESDRDPAWSPDGRMLALVRRLCWYDNYYGYGEYCYDAVVVMSADGRRSSAPVAAGIEPAWSTDGKNIAYTVIGCDDEGACEPQFLGIVRANGTLTFTLGPRASARPAWRRGGAR